MQLVRISLHFILFLLCTCKYGLILKSSIIHMAFSENKQFYKWEGDDMIKMKGKRNLTEERRQHIRPK